MALRILFLVPLYPPVLGGAELQAQQLARSMADRGAAVEVLTTSVAGAPAREEESGGVIVHRRVPTVAYHGLWGASNALGTLAFLAMRGARFDAFLGFGLTSFLNPPALLWKRAGRRPLVARCECSGPFGDLGILGTMTAGGLLRSGARRFSAVVALTEGMKEELQGAGFDPARIEVIPNGVDTTFFSPVVADPAGPPALVFVGRLAAQKGVPVLLEAFHRLRASRPDLVLEILGEGPDRQALLSRAEGLGLASQVHFRGVVPRGQVRDALAGAAAVVHPSLGEGMCCVLLEAMACGAPIVTTDIAPNRALLRPGVDCLMVPPGDPAALAEATETVLADGGKARRIAAAARERAVREFSMEAMAARYLDLFRRQGAAG